MDKEIVANLYHSWEGFLNYRKTTIKERADLLRQIAKEIDLIGEILIQTAAEETNLTVARLNNEKNRTIFQLNSYADATESCQWMNLSIDLGDKDRNPPKLDLRKTMEPLGPVLVFGASNFPFAYSTAGGDTASAFASGCSVIVKAHPAHPKTSDLVAQAIWKALEKCNLDKNIFQHIYCDDFQQIEEIVQYNYIKAVGFTGSLKGGKAIFDYANKRKEPIPVFAEMGSTNPVFIFENYLKNHSVQLASQLADSITLGMGQFCTKPGLVFIQNSEDCDLFIQKLADNIDQIIPANLLHSGIYKNYLENSALHIHQPNVAVLTSNKHPTEALQVKPTIITCDAFTFIGNPVLHEEVFGPMALVIKYDNERQLKHLIDSIQGQLTCSVFAENEDIQANNIAIDSIKMICGRLNFNTVPTGVEVCLSMQHGGPYPATTDSRFTSVGADAIKRFARPLTYQNAQNHYLPDELKNENPLGVWRTVNNQLTNSKL